MSKLDAGHGGRGGQGVVTTIFHCVPAAAGKISLGGVDYVDNGSVNTGSLSSVNALIAKPNSGYSFDHWAVSPAGSAGIASFTSASTTLTPNYYVPCDLYCYFATGGGGGAHQITVSPNPAIAPANITVSGSGFTANVQAIVYFGGATYTPSVGGDGAFSLPVLNVPVGTYAVYAVDHSGASSNTVTLTVTQGQVVTPTIGVNPTSVIQGNSVTVTGSQFTPNTIATIFIAQGVVQQIAQVSGSGSFSKVISIGTSVPAGTETVVAQDSSGSLSNSVNIVVVTYNPPPTNAVVTFLFEDSATKLSLGNSVQVLINGSPYTPDTGGHLDFNCTIGDVLTVKTTATGYNEKDLTVRVDTQYPHVTVDMVATGTGGGGGLTSTELLLLAGVGVVVVMLVVMGGKKR